MWKTDYRFSMYYHVGLSDRFHILIPATPVTYKTHMMNTIGNRASSKWIFNLFHWQWIREIECSIICWIFLLNIPKNITSITRIIFSYKNFHFFFTIFHSFFFFSYCVVISYRVKSNKKQAEMVLVIIFINRHSMFFNTILSHMLALIIKNCKRQKNIHIP